MKMKKMIWLACLPMLVACGAKTNTSVNSASGSSNSVSTPVESSTSQADTKVSSSSEDTPGSFVMEAEYTNVTGKKGAGYSGGSSGKEMVQKDEDGSAKASNGYWLGYLYVTNMSVDFVFNSTKAVNDVTLTLRLTCEIKNITLTSDNYKITVNDEEITDYGTFTLTGASNSDSTGYVRPFSNHKLKKKINIKEGENTIKLITNNSEGMGGTMYATAPMVDCITFTDFGDATLTYDPILDNLSLFEE